MLHYHGELNGLQGMSIAFCILAWIAIGGMLGMATSVWLFRESTAKNRDLDCVCVGLLLAMCFIFPGLWAIMTVFDRYILWWLK